MSTAPASLEPRPYRPRSLQAGPWRVTALSDGHLRLDGGSMWGVVPRALWERMTPPAADHTILLALRPFLAERAGFKVLIEGGVGDRWEEKWRRIYHIEPTTTLEAALAACGSAPEEITHVVLSHCHWDHCGACVALRGGQLVPRFPAARHFAPRVEVEIAKRPGHARAGSYRAEDVEPLERAGVLQTYAGDSEILPDLWVHELGGHSDGVSLITLNESGPGEAAVFWSDIVPTTHHIQPPYIMAYDIDVVRSYEVRARWLARACDAGFIGLFYHDVDHAFGRLARQGSRYALEPL